MEEDILFFLARPTEEGSRAKFLSKENVKCQARGGLARMVLETWINKSGIQILVCLFGLV